MKYIFKKDSFIETYNSPKYLCFMCLNMCKYKDYELMYNDRMNFIHFTIENNELSEKNGFFVAYNNLKRELKANYNFLVFID